ncbi:MAG: hypothetical protein ACD_20C00105G0001, partial [uncultured bacterium]
MQAAELKKGIYWVGAIDWSLKEFHGYLTQKGTTYNAYLIIDEKIVLIDTVKDCCKSEMLSRIESVINPSKIDIVISNHSEMDHSGSLPDIMNICKNAKLVCSPNGEKNLKEQFGDVNWDFHIVKTGDKINIGKRNLSFVLTQMVHWPDSMATYVEEEKLLLPNDTFGQHIASYERFDDQYNEGIIFEEAKKYFANIMMPYASQIIKAMSELEKLDTEMIAPSHGLIWRKNPEVILNAYKHWENSETKNKAVIVFDSMWGSTKKMAYAIYKAFEKKQILVQIRDLKAYHISDIMTEIVDAKYICVGSPTLNNTMLPTAASFLCYLKGLKPKNRIGLSFGSYGWGGQSVDEIQQAFEFLNYQIMDPIKFLYVPKEKDLQNIMQDLIKKL